MGVDGVAGHRLPMSGKGSDNVSHLSPGARFLDAPNDPEFAALVALWHEKCGSRKMPSRADFNPAEFVRLLPAIFLVDVTPDKGTFRGRLFGEKIIAFLGTNPKGKSPAEILTPGGADALRELLGHVVESRKPTFRAGLAYWAAERNYIPFEACLLPLSADGQAVNMILGALKLFAL